MEVEYVYYVSKKWFEFAMTIVEGSVITKDYEIISITIIIPAFKKLFIACVYKPPKGKVETCLKFLNDLVEKYKQQKYG